MRNIVIGFILVSLGLTISVDAQHVSFIDESFEFDRNDPAIGLWIGTIEARQGPLFAVVEFNRESGDQPAGTMTMLAYGAINAACDDIVINNDAIEFTISTMLGEARFSGSLNEDRQRFAGQMAIAQPQADAASKPEARAFEFARSVHASKQRDARAYSGKLDVPQMGQLALTVVLAKTPKENWIGQVDVPGQMLLAYPLVNAKEVDGTIRAMMPVPGFPAMIEAKVDDGTNRLVGRFKQATFDLELNLAHDAGYVAPTLRRPQHPKPPFPYRSQDLRIPVAEGIELAGTLTLPGESVAKPPYALAILISGSGPQDRDETIFGHKPFLVLSDYLTRHGIAVFRYDDRGVGESGGLDGVNQCTSQDFARDVSAIVDVLKGQDQIDAKRIGLIGHSEGGMIAPMVAAERDDIAYLVLLAGTAVTGKEILLKQGRLILKAEGADDAAADAYAAQQAAMLELLEKGAGDDEIRQALVESMQGDDGEALPTSVEAQLSALKAPWLQFFVTFDPRPALAKVKCPVLALNGELDLQVWHEQNLPEIEQSIRGAGGDVTVKRYQGLNHLFQPAKTGGISEYAVSEITFDEQVMRDILIWLNQKIGAGNLP